VAVIGDLSSSLAKSRKGRIAWKTRRMLPGEFGLHSDVSIREVCSSHIALNSKDLLPKLTPVTSAPVDALRVEMCRLKNRG
jgi:hypothetical protein